MKNSDNIPQSICLQFEEAVLTAVTTATAKSIASDFAPYGEPLKISNGITFVPLFTGESLEVNPDGTVDWDKRFAQHHRSSVLHLYSLEAVGRLLRTYSNDKGVEKVFLSRLILRDFFRFCSNPVQLETVSNCPSSDHSTATRVKVLIQYLNIENDYLEKDAPLLREVVLWLYYWSEWLFINKDDTAGNHELMGALALLHAGIQFKEIRPISVRYIDTACQRTIRLVGDAFDKDGLCNENTIGYHSFNLYLYGKFVDFLRSHDIASGYCGEIESHLEKARHALRLCIRQDGTLPPIGDSAIYKVKYDSINKSFCFAESGFAVIKNDDLYLSLICGSRTEIHKQVDDTSITLRYKGCDLIVDGGSYLYDRLDRHRICLESSRGHSGIFIEQFDSLLRNDFIKKTKPIKSSILSFSENTNEADLECICTLCDGVFELRRRIKVFFPDEIIIHDAVISTTQKTVAIQRFLLAPGVSFEPVADQVWWLKGGTVTATLFQLSPSRVDHYCGDYGEVVRGWYSTEYKKINPIEGVDFVQSGGTSLQYMTIIKLSEVTSLSELSLEAIQFINNYIVQCSG